MDAIQITDMAGARRLPAVASPVEAEVRASDFLIALDGFGAIAPTGGDLASDAAPPAGQEDDDAHDMSAADLGQWLPPATAPAALFQSVAQTDIVAGHQGDTVPAASARGSGHLPTAPAPGRHVVTAPERGTAFADIIAKTSTEIAGRGDSALSVLSPQSAVSALPSPTGAKDSAGSAAVVGLNLAEPPTDTPAKLTVPEQARSGDQKIAVTAGHIGPSNDWIDAAPTGNPNKIAVTEGHDAKVPRPSAEAATAAPPLPTADPKFPIASLSDQTRRFGAGLDDAPDDRMPDASGDRPARDTGPAGHRAAPEVVPRMAAAVDQKHFAGSATRTAVRNGDLAGDPAPTRPAPVPHASVVLREGSTPPEIAGRIVDPEPGAKGPAQADHILQDIDPAGPSRPPGEAKGPERAAETAPSLTGHRVLPSGLGHQLAEAAARFPGQPVEVTLIPEELGKVRMTLTTTDGGLTLLLVADRPETLALMRRHIDQLAQDFRDLGFQNLSFSFAHGRDQGRAHSAVFVPDEDTPLTGAMPGNPRPHSLNSLPPVPADGLDIRM